MTDPAIEAAIARGSVLARTLEMHRAGLFVAMRAIVVIAGREGLKACVLGILTAVQNETRASAAPLPKDDHNAR